MVFASTEFLVFFLPIALALYFVVPRKLKNASLLFSSLIFYSWGEPVYVVLMCFSIMLNYVSGLFFAKVKNKGWRNVILFISVAINLGMLGVFKYANLFVDGFNSITGLAVTSPSLVLPIGISFYTFQAMSYTIDVYRGDVEVQYNPVDFGAFVTMFPQLIAGPIVRYSDVARELAKREINMTLFGQGTRRFILGLGKKVLLANTVAVLWNSIQDIFRANGGELPAALAWVGILAFALQIYFDFSGYSDMGIGMGKMLGFNFPENFNYPYVSRSISEFWRRWHMTLGTWFRDYVYFPMGGSRVNSKFRLVFNLMVVWLLTGFWHGAAWNFLLWGVYFGVLISIEKLFLGKWLEAIPGVFGKVVSWTYCFVLVVIGWVMFNFLDFAEVIAYLKSMFGLAGQPFYNNDFLRIFSTNWRLLLVLIVAAVPWWHKVLGNQKVARLSVKPVGIILSSGYYLLILIVSIAYLVANTYNPFIYFRF